MISNISGSLTLDQLSKLDTIDNDASNTSYKESQVLDKDAFLKLMMTQLQYQNPLDPMDSTQYMEQMAQFTSVEQLSNIASAMSDNNTLTENMALQLSSLSSLIDEMGTYLPYSQSISENQTSLLEQNEAILEQLKLLNEKIESYGSSASSVSDEEIMDAILGD